MPTHAKGQVPTMDVRQKGTGGQVLGPTGLLFFKIYYYYLLLLLDLAQT